MKIVQKTMTFPEPLLKEVKRYQQENMIPTFTGAMQDLIRKGLQKTKEKV